LYNWIGKNVKRKEDRSLLMGNGKFIADLKVDNMLHACFLRSIHAHAALGSIDTSKAVRLPGVVGVWTADDLQNLGDIQPLAMLPLSIHEKVSLKRKEWSQPPLAKGKVRFVGEPIAVVLAESRHIAEDAVQLIEVKYEPLKAINSYEQAMNSHVRLFDTWENNVQSQFEIETGNWQEKFANATIVLERTYRMRRSAGVPIECRGVMAEMDPANLQLVVWTSTQVPHFVRNNLAAALDCPVEQIGVKAPDVGGGFGIKGNVYPEELVIPYLVRKLNIPVKWVEDRVEHMKNSKPCARPSPSPSGCFQ
jgi:carbon-monoxide dehydrogenase large subunit